MKNYRLIEAVYSKADPIDLVDPDIRLKEAAMAFYMSDYEIHEIDQYATIMCEGDLLLEWSLKEFVTENLSNLFQFIIGAGLEFGLVMTGFGAPLAPFAEMANDVVFLSMSAGETIAAIKSFFSGSIGKLKEAFKTLINVDVKAAPSVIYERLQGAINSIGTVLGPMGLGVAAALEKMTEVLRDMIRGMAKTIGDIAGVFSPIPGTDVLVQEAIVATVDSTYDILSKIVDKMPDWMGEYFYNPGKLVDQITEMCSNGVAMIGKIKVSDNEDGFLGKVWGFAKNVVKGPLEWLKKLLQVDKIADKLMGWLEKAKGMLTPFIDMMKKVVPTMWMGAASLAVLINEDYEIEGIMEDAGENDEAEDEESSGTSKKKSDGDKSSKKKKKSGGFSNMFNVQVDESYIREEIGRNYHTINDGPYTWENYSNVDHEIYANDDGGFSAKVNCISDKNLSTDLRNFPDEYSAAHWAKEQSERINRHTINNLANIKSLKELYNLN